MIKQLVLAPSNTIVASGGSQERIHGNMLAKESFISLILLGAWRYEVAKIRDAAKIDIQLHWNRNLLPPRPFLSPSFLFRLPLFLFLSSRTVPA